MGNMKMRNFRNKLKLLYLKQILEEHTDGKTGLTHAEIMELLKKKGVDVQPRTLRDDIQCLQEAAGSFHMRIETNIQEEKDKAHPIRYRVEKRLFTPAEVKLLMESVKGMHSLSDRQTEKLLDKLSHLCSEPEAKKMRGQLAVVGGFKAPWGHKLNRDLLLHNISAVDQALDAGQKVEFRYYWYSMDKKPAFPRDKLRRHVVSPLVRVLEKGFHYMVAVDENGLIRHFRMDRMTSTVVSNEKAETSEDAALLSQDWESYVNSTFGLGLSYNPYYYVRHGGQYNLNGMNGETYTVHMQLTRDLVGAVLDRFGMDVEIQHVDKGHCIAVFEAYHNALFVAWVLSLGNKVRILGPERLADDIAYYARATGRWHSA